MQKVLFISSRPLFPVVGGDQIRTVQQLEFLLQRYRVDVLYMTESKEQDVTKEHLLSVDNVFCFHVPKWRCYWQTLHFLFNAKPLQVNYYYNKRVQRFIAEHLSEYDMMFCNNIRTAEYVWLAKDVRKYIDFVDAISMNYARAQHKAKGLKKLIYKIDGRRCARYEQQVIRNFDNCAIISEVDKQYLLDYGTDNPCGRE